MHQPCSLVLNQFGLLNTSRTPPPSLQPASRVRSTLWKTLKQIKRPVLSWDVQQKKQQTGAHWTGIDTQLGVALMSRKAVFSFFLFSFCYSWSVQITLRRRNTFFWIKKSWYLCFRWFCSWKVAGSIPAVSLLSIPVERNEASCRPLTSGPSSEATTCLRCTLFFIQLMIKLLQMIIHLNPATLKV